MWLEILLMLRSSIVLLEDQPAYTETLWEKSNHYLATTFGDLSEFDLFDLPILDELEDFFEDFDYRSIILDLGVTDYANTAMSALLPEAPLPERMSVRTEPIKTEPMEPIKKKKQKKYKNPSKKFKPFKFAKRKS